MTLTLDVTNAAARFRTLAGLGDNGIRYAAGRNQPGKCTRWTWLALSEDGQGFQNSTPLPSAVAAWNNAPAEHRHPLTEKPFAGAVLVFGPTAGPRWAGDENYPYGDVTVLDGSGFDSGDWQDWGQSATDAAGVGVIASVTAGTRYVQTGRRPVLGWLSSYGGAVLQSGSGTRPADTSTLIPATVHEEDDDMFMIQHDSKGRGTLLIYGGGKQRALNAEQVSIIGGLKRADGTPQVPLYGYTNQGEVGERRFDVIRAAFK